MKITNLILAATIHNKITCEENNDTRLPDTSALEEQFQQTGISKADARLFSDVCFCYHDAIQVDIAVETKRVYQAYLNAYAINLDKTGSFPNQKSTRLFEIAASLEV